MNNQNTKTHSNNRDDYFRCNICGKLNLIDGDTLRDPVTEAYKCKYGCEKSYVQPNYESPLQDY